MTVTLTHVGLGTDSAVSGGRIVVYRSGYVYMGGRGTGGDGLIVWDVSDPTDPEKVAQVSGGVEFGRGVVLDGDVAYVCGRDNGSLVSYDITDPTDPTVLDLHEDMAQWGARGLIVRGDRLFMLCGKLSAAGTDGVAVFDITDPSDLSVTCRITKVDDTDVVSSGYGVIDEARDLLWVGDYNNTSGTGDSIVAYDISDPDDVTVRSSHTFSDEILYGCRGIKLVGNTLLVASEATATVASFDVTDPDNVTLHTAVTDPVLDGARDTSIIGDTLLVSARTSRNLVALDITDPTTPTIAASLFASTLVNAYGNANDGTNYVFVPSTSSGNLNVIRFQNVIVPPDPPNLGYYVVADGLPAASTVYVKVDGELVAT